MKRTVKLLISLLYYALDLVFKRVARLLGIKAEPRCVIVYYHGVPQRTRQNFARQMDMLIRNARPIFVDHSGELESGSRYVSVTFDDAFESVLENAVPELVSRSIPATIFVPLGVLGKVPSWEMDSGVSDLDEKVMSSEQLRTLPPDLIRLGSHTMTHLKLSKIDDSTLEWELNESKRQLETLLNSPVTLLAFPYGDHNGRVLEKCADLGYSRLFSVVPKFSISSHQDFVRGRVSVSPSDGRLEFFLKLHGAYSWIPYASKLKAGMRSAIGSRSEISGEVPGHES